MPERADLMDGSGQRAGADAVHLRAGSLEDLYVRHLPESTRLAFLLTRDAASAEDLAQEAFIKAAGRLRNLRHPGAFDAYLRRTVVNLCMSFHRREKVARTYAERERAWASGRVPASKLPDVETTDEIRTALADLPPRQRAAIVLRFYADLTESQIADSLGCSVGAARALVFRAMETLRDRIGDEP
jgi:RNA polymerase sigma-70 factor (sigma-E family)